MRSKQENGVALITALLVLFLVSALVVGMSWMVMSDQRLGGNNRDRESAFYAAEAGMEAMTAAMGNDFGVQGSLTAADITAIEAAPPPIPGITFQNALGQSTYQLVGDGTPQSGTILPPSPYAGMNGLITPYELTVAAQTADGSEVKLQRSVQVVAIPVFQFGIFSQTDLSFFAGPVFDFGGRVHTNGNLWLAANEGPLFMRDKITAVGEVIRTNLENGTQTSTSTSGSYGGIVSIARPTPQPQPASEPASPYTNTQWRALAQNEGSVTGNSVYGAVSTMANPLWTTGSNPLVPNGTVPSQYDGMLENGVQPLNLVGTALSGLQSPVNLIRRPLVNEETGNPAQFAQRDFGSPNLSLRILLDDYPPGSPGPNQPNACHLSDMMQLNDGVSAGDPLDLATLAPVTGNTLPPSWWAGSPETFYPLPTAYDPSNSYVPPPSPFAAGGYEYWIKNGEPTITGCLKIEYQNTAGVWSDVTEEILKEGFIGRNINPQPKCTPPRRGSCTQPNAPSYGPEILPATGNVVGPQGPPNSASGWINCTDPNPNAIIRFARLRDNPSIATSGGCGGNSDMPSDSNGYDYWPLALYDTREAINRDVGLGTNSDGNPSITAAGVMYYVELDVNNLARWFTHAIGTSGLSATNVGGYSVYFSDRRGNQVDPSTGFGVKVGAYGFNDMVNPNDPTNGCPNGILDQPGEDLEGDGIFRNYGGIPLTPAAQAALGTSNLGVYNMVSSGLGTSMASVLAPISGYCTDKVNGTAPSPNYGYVHNEDARENPPMFFRRALKLVDGASFTLGTACFGASPNPPCGLTIASENPVYIQGDFNAPNNGTFSPAGVASSVVADAVTLLSDNWNDVNSFISPYDPNSRPRATTAYRVAIISGKGIPFPIGNVSNSGPDFGTDGGLHNFLRYLEGNGGTLYYEGSLVSFYFNRQAIGLYKCCNTVYGAPARTYSFDANFSNGPQWLPPITPQLRSINTIGFSQDLLPTQ